MELSKRKIMAIKAAIFLLAFCVMTCYAMRANAKFIVSNSNYNSARVAHFGVTIDTGALGESGGFSRVYATDDESVAGTITNSVVSTDYVLAPGTKGDMFSVTIKGIPEVAVAVKYEAAFEVSNWTAFEGTNNACFYCPVIIYVGQDTIKGIEYDNQTAFENAVKTAIEKYSASYEAGQNLEGIQKPVVSWEWEFESGEGDEAKAKNDEKDTSIGNRQSEGRKQAFITLQIKTTVTQID